MKINVEFDLTPEEFRRSLGLPDVEAFQKDLLERIYKQMESGAEGYDPMSLMQPFLQQGLSQNMTQGLSQGLSQGLASFGTYQQMMLDMLRQAGSASGQAASKSAEGDASAAAADQPASGRAKAASARSRSRRSE